MISRLHVGVDISKKFFDVYYLLEKKEFVVQFSNSENGRREFIESIKNLAKKVHACMEYTGCFETKLALDCKEAGFTVSIVDGAKISHYGRSFSSSGITTDKRSAYLLARYCKERRPEEWFPLPDEFRKLRELVRHRERLKQSKTEWSCRAAHVVEDELVTAQRRCLIDVLAVQINDIDKKIADHVEAHANLKESVRLVDSIPGIAFISATRIVAEAGPIENYACAKSLAMAAGLVPIVVHSGQKTPPGKLPIYGNRELRCALYFPTVVCFGKDVGVGPFMKKVASNGNKTKMTQIAAGMRKIAHLVFGILTTGKPYDPDKC